MTDVNASLLNDRRLVTDNFKTIRQLCTRTFFSYGIEITATLFSGWKGEKLSSVRIHNLNILNLC